MQPKLRQDEVLMCSDSDVTELQQAYNDGKISKKNAFQLQLATFMGHLRAMIKKIGQKDEHAGTFQEASSRLQAAADVYRQRVDVIGGITHSMLSQSCRRPANRMLSFPHMRYVFLTPKAHL
jgi:hypothetical protein